MNESWVWKSEKSYYNGAFESTSNIDEENRCEPHFRKALSRQNVAALKKGSSRGQSAIRSIDLKAMKCSDLHTNLALYAAGSTDASDTVKAHLEVCPLCRQQFAEFREISNGLRQLRRPEISAALKTSLKQNVRTELRNSKTAWLPFTPDIREWLTMSFMPYSVGVCASLVVGLTFLTMMYSGVLKPGGLPSKAGSSILLASNRSSFGDSSSDISPSDYAKTRLGFGEESPSINPKGALIALTRSLVRGGMKDDEVVVVADVFGNGLAQIAEVVEPSRDRRAVSELEKALDSDPSYAPFVPTSMENRPESVRVVLKFQSVNVNATPKHRPKRNL